MSSFFSQKSFNVTTMIITWCFIWSRFKLLYIGLSYLYMMVIIWSILVQLI